MAGPAWLTGIFAGLMITVAVYCASRLAVARRWQRRTHVDTDGAHVIMGVTMAGMLEAVLRFGSAGIWEAVFVGAAGWFGWQFVRVRRGARLSASRCPQPLPHLVECGAMLYMLLAPPAAVAVRSAAGGMGGMSVSATESRFSLLTLVLALFMFGYVVWVGDRLTLRTPAVAVPMPASVGCAGAGPGQQPYLAPRCGAMCKIAMGITMGYMLILML